MARVIFSDEDDSSSAPPTSVTSPGSPLSNPGSFFDVQDVGDRRDGTGVADDKVSGPGKKHGEPRTPPRRSGGKRMYVQAYIAELYTHE